MKLLVTGSGGFVGQWLMEHLGDIGDEAVGLGADIDITDAAALTEAVTQDEPEAICHLAAQASVGISWSEAARTFDVNAVGTLNLLDAAMACAVPPRVLLISSAEVYGQVKPEDLPIAESRPFRPVSPYAASKAAAELIGLQRWLGHGLEVIRARPFNHTGPGQPPTFVVPSLARQVAAARHDGRTELRGGDLSVRRDLSDVRDVVRAYRLLISHGIPGEVYNVCRGESNALEDLARRLLTLAGLDLPIVVDPELVRPVDLPDLRGDPGLLRAATGWQPERTVDDMLTEVLQYWIEAGSAG